MKRTFIAAIVLAGTLMAVGCTPGRYSQYDRSSRTIPDSLSTMKKQDIVSLSKAGISDSLIIAMVDVSNSWFNLKTQDVIDLKNAGVSDNVIHALIGATPPSAEQNGSGTGRYAYYYPPYYWYAGYTPYWYDPFWYYPSFYYGYNYHYRPAVFHRYVVPHRSFFGNYGTHSSGRSSGGRSGEGRRR